MSFDGMETPGRNDACWCGSGKKYKKCHLANDERMEDLASQGFEVLPRTLLKSAADIEGIKYSAEVNVGSLDYVAEHIGVGTTTEEIDQWVYNYCIEHDAIPADLNYEGFPKSVCTSINEVVCHGIPNDWEVLEDGDIINVDCTTILDGYYADASRMYVVGGRTAPKWQKLVDVAWECLKIGEEVCSKPYVYVGDIGNAIQKHARKNGFSVVRDLSGHGTGLQFHEDPDVDHYGHKGTGMLLVPGMVFTIEPMINMGTYEVFCDEEDGWTVVTEDEQPSAQWEHTFVMTEHGVEVLTH